MSDTTNDAADQGDQKKDPGFDPTLRARVEEAANAKADQVLETFANVRAPDASIEDLAAALWLKQWLGYSEWDGSGRGSGGSVG